MRRTLSHYFAALTESYRNRGLSGIRADVKEHLWWRWYRLRMHPRFRGIYRGMLRVGRLTDPRSFTDADPFKIIYVDPADITYSASSLPATWGRVIGGDWDLEPFAETRAYKVAKLRFREGYDWTEIPHSTHDSDTLETLYRRISEEGYKSQRELAHTGSGGSLTWDCEVGVGIDAEGEIVWTGRGYHRLTTAKILELDEIPVQVRIRHPEWQAIRDEIRGADVATDLSERARERLTHPDLQDARRTLSDSAEIGSEQ